MTTCNNILDDATILSSLGLVLPPINPNYFDDPNVPKSSFAIDIFRDNVAYDFGKWYASLDTPKGDMYIEDNRGSQRGRAKFTIIDYKYDVSTIPFKPIPNLKVKIYNQNRTDLFFTGSIWSVKPQIITQRCDGTAVKAYKIECVDNTIELERAIVVEIYENKTTGFIIKDIIRRFTCLDDSAINATQGTVIESLHVNGEYPSELITRLLGLEHNWTMWLDPVTDLVYVGVDVDVLNSAPMIVDESNIMSTYEYSSISFRADARGLRNSFSMFYNQGYTRGTVNVANGATVVFGTGTEWVDATNLENGATLKVSGDDQEYSVDHVNNNGELILSSAYQGATATAVNYEIYGKGMRRAISKSDPVSINFLKQLRGEQGKSCGGVFAGRITNDNNRYTMEEAIQVLNGHLLDWTNPLLAGTLKTLNSLLTVTGLRAGQVVDINLPNTCGTVANGVIQRLVRKDTGAILCRDDGRIDPLLDIEITFNERAFDIRQQLKRIMKDVDKQVVNDSGKVIEVVKDAVEQFFLQDCMDIVPATTISDTLTLSDNFSVILPVIIATDSLQLSDSFTSTQITALPPFYTTPTTNQAGYCIGMFQYGAVS